MLTRCPRCGDVFSKERFDLCPKCRTEEVQRLDALSRFIETNPDATLEELERVSGMSKAVILTYAREGRLTSLDAAAIKVQCEECGAPITSGRFCPSCRKKLASKFESGVQQIRSYRKK